jgi:hypothetical protein
MLRLAWHCKEWGALPEAGGLRDQRAGEIGRMTQVYNVWLAHKRWKATPGKERGTFAKRYPDDWKIYRATLELRDDNGK